MFSRDPLRSPEILKPKTYSITPTIVRQVITFFLGLLIGLGTTCFLTWVANHHTIQFTDGSTTGFGLYAGVTFVAFCFSFIVGIYWQHENSATIVQVNHTWIYYFFVIGFFSGLFDLIGLLMVEPTSALFIVLYQLALVFHFSLIIVKVQGFALKRMAFNENDHRWLMSPEASLWACKAGVLPYRVKIRAFWLMISCLVVLLFSSALAWVAVTSDRNPDTGERIFSCLFFPFLILIFLWGTITTWEVLMAKKFSTVEGKISKSTMPHRYRTPPTYTVHYNDRSFSTKDYLWYNMIEGSRYTVRCNERSFSTEDYLWYSMIEGSRYKLWCIPFGLKTKMIAFEKIPEPQPIIKPVFVPQKVGCLPKLFQLGRRGRNAKHSKSPELH